MRAVAFRAAAVLGGVLVALLLLELGLQALAIVSPARLVRATRAFSGDETVRIVCVGDSHTYGVLVPVTQSYPSRLEHHLRAGGLAAAVVNLGVPGQSARQVRQRLPRYLELYRPHVVSVFAGINNAWNVAERDDAEVPWQRHLLYRIRLLRFLSLLRGVEVPEMQPTERVELRRGEERVWHVQRDGLEDEVRPERRGEAADAELLERWTREDFDEIAAIARAHGTEPIFVLYPFAPMLPARAVNAAIRDVASRHDVPLVDGAALFVSLRGEGTWPLLFDDPGLHPRPVLYDAIAREVADRVRWIVGADPQKP